MRKNASPLMAMKKNEEDEEDEEERVGIELRSRGSVK